MFILEWPPEEPMGQPSYFQAAIVSAVEGGFLLAVPGLPLADDAFEFFSVSADPGQEPLMDPFLKTLVPLLDLDEEGLSAHDQGIYRYHVDKF